MKCGMSDMNLKWCSVMPDHHDFVHIVNSDTLFWISVRKQENRVDRIQHFQNLFCSVLFN